MAFDWLGLAVKALPAAISAGATLYGASQASKGQNKGAEIVAQAQREATAAEQEGIHIAQANMQRQQQAASPGLMAMQGIIGRGEALTPYQEQALADARRRAVDTLQGGSVRGSARATAATVADVEGRIRGQFMEQNRNRSDQAASNLSGQYFGAGDKIANYNLGAGQSASQGLLGIGATDYANAINQGVIKGQAIGNIGAVIADSMKNDDIKTRESSYAPVGDSSIYNSILWKQPKRVGVTA